GRLEANTLHRWVRRRSCRTAPFPARSPRECAGGTSKSRRRELQLVCERSANWDRLLSFVRYAVVAVFQAESVPVHRGRDVAIVADAHCNFGSLVDVQVRAWDRAVVGQHAQVVTVDVLANGSDAEIEVVAVV